jgi:hypothetical protein
MHAKGPGSQPTQASTNRRLGTIELCAPAALAVAMIVIGTVIGWRSWHDAWTLPNLARYTYGDRHSVAGVPEGLAAALRADYKFISGYGLVLAGFAWIFRRRALSRFGRTISGYVCVAVVVTVLADVAENLLLHLTLTRVPNPPTLITMVGAATTIKWCAALLAVAAIPATLAMLGRAVVAWVRLNWLKRRADVGTDRWWTLVLADEKSLELRPPDTPPTAPGDDESMWVNSYKVPGAQAVIDTRSARGQAVTAICLSGGGVRSACVAMGAMQVFSEADPIYGLGRPVADKPAQPGASTPTESGANAPAQPGAEIPADPQTAQTPRRLVDDVDYVISVSGGGYTAGARLLAVQPPPGKAGDLLVSQRFEEGSPEFDHFRRGSSYIADTPAELMRALAEVLKNMLASLVTIFVVAIIVGWLAGFALAHPLFSIAAFVPVENKNFESEIKPPHHNDYLMSLVPHPAAWWAIGFFAVLAVFCTTVAIMVEWARSGRVSERIREWAMRGAQASAAFAVLVLTVTAALPGLMHLCASISENASENGKTTAAAITGVVGLNYLSAIVAMAWKKRNKLPPAKPSWWGSVLPAGVLQLTLVLATLALLLVVWLVTLGSFAAGVFSRVTSTGYGTKLNDVPNWEWWIGLLVGTALFVGFADVTSLSLHPFYRYRLARTFAVRRASIPPDVPAGQEPAVWRAQRYPETEWTFLHEYGHVPGKGPQFVFAAAATLTGEATPAPGLNAVSYTMSADYVGGPDLGWFKTEPLWKTCPPRLKRDLTVEAAVAISGAAFASAMGRQNKGFQKLLAVSGARLGTWLPNPKFVQKLKCSQEGGCIDPKDAKKFWPRSLPTIRGAGYFYRELLGINYDDARLVQVTDGGHYENLGLVEALRRRCRLIICIDGGGDTPPLLGGLGDAIRLAKYELGVNITLTDAGTYSEQNITPGSGTPFPEDDAFVGLNDRITKATVVTGHISYPPASGLSATEGVLIFGKAVLWEQCPDWLLTYAASKGNEVFPHDPTSDQWFNEGQFAAYTTLGRLIGRHAAQCIEDLATLDELATLRAALGAALPTAKPLPT